MKMPKTISKGSWKGYYNSYFFGEKEGANLVEKLLDFAPGKDEKMWIRIWAAEENYHHKLWSDLAAKKKIKMTAMPGNIAKIYNLAAEYVARKDWIGSMVSATIIEHIGSTIASYLYKFADEDTRLVFKRITADDMGHLNFDLMQLEKIAETAEGRQRIIDAHKKFLKEFMNMPSQKDLLDGELDIINEAYIIHRMKLARFGVVLPEIRFSGNVSLRIKNRIAGFFS